MGAHPLYNGQGATVTYREALSGTASSEKLPAGRAVERCIAKNSVFVRGKASICWWGNDNLPASHALARVIVGLTTQNQAHTRDTKCAKALTCRPLKDTGDTGSRQTGVSMPARDLSCKAGSD